MKKNTNLKIYKEETNLQIKDLAWEALAEGSQKAYSFDYQLFLKFIKKDLKNIKAGDILKYIEYLEKNNYKNSSINRKIASLSKMFKIMKISGEIEINPVELLKQFKNISYKISKGINIALTIEDIRKTVKKTKTISIQEKKIILIIKMLAMTGLRISEFINIKNKDIYNFNSENKIIKIIGKGKKERKIYISNTFLSEIKKIYPDKKDIEFLFYNTRNNLYNRKTLWIQIKQFFRKKINKNVNPHMLRHFYATYKIFIEKQDVKAVSKFLGHSSVSITLDAYVDTALDVNNSKIKI